MATNRPTYRKRQSFTGDCPVDGYRPSLAKRAPTPDDLVDPETSKLVDAKIAAAKARQALAVTVIAARLEQVRKSLDEIRKPRR